MTLAIEQKFEVDTQDCPGCNLGKVYSVQNTWWTPTNPGYGPGVMIERRGWDVVSCDNGGTPGLAEDQVLTRYYFILPGGTEVELRDKLTDGKPLKNVGVPNRCTDVHTQERGTEFVAADGSGMTFQLDSVFADATQTYISVHSQDQRGGSGYLRFRDGTAYRIVLGSVMWIQDRNGNRITFEYDGQGRVVRITDSLLRVFEVSYASGTQAYDQISQKVGDVHKRLIKIHKGSHAAAANRVDGSGAPTFDQLFPQSELNNHLLSPIPRATPFTPDIVTGVEMPNGQS
ncbi:MAG: RHS repeat domain-containing protein, partial [Bryobacteraceae bacterium]|nr:RHS repeat domain-containing protein [Bryobacteraceae bacterium]